MTIEAQLIPLPNKDLWRGHKRGRKAADNLTAAERKDMPRPHPLDAAMAVLLLQANGASELTCQWCGQQAREQAMRDHLKANHPSIVSPPSVEQVALAAVQMEVAKSVTE